MGTTSLYFLFAALAHFHFDLAGVDSEPRCNFLVLPVLDLKHVYIIILVVSGVDNLY